jgi:hypothetical protein
VAYSGHVDPDLMGTPGINTNPNQTVPMIRTCPDNLVGGSGRKSPLVDDSHPRFDGWMPTDGTIDFTLVGIRNPMDNSQIFLVNFAACKGIYQPDPGWFIQGDQHQSGCILVQAMDNAGTFRIHLPYPWKMVNKDIDQGRTFHAGRRMNRKSRGLVNNQDILILVHDKELSITGGNAFLHPDRLKTDMLADFKTSIGFRAWHVLDTSQSLLDPFLDLGSGNALILEHRGPENIQPATCMRSVDNRTDNFVIFLHSLSYVKHPLANKKTRPAGIYGL